MCFGTLPSIIVKVPKTLVNILSSCDSVSVLIWASAAGWVASLVLVCGQGILSLPEAMETWMEGMKVILWSICRRSDSHGIRRVWFPRRSHRRCSLGDLHGVHVFALSIGVVSG